MDNINPGRAIPGVELLDSAAVLHPLANLAHDHSGWKTIFEETRAQLKNFVRSRDSLEVLCKSASRRLIQFSPIDEDRGDWQFPLEQADVEMLHALVLTYGKVGCNTPTSPRNFERIWPIVSKNLFAFSGMQATLGSGQPLDTAIARVRLHTLYYRNPYDRVDCERTVRNILRHIDEPFAAQFGFRISDGFEMLLDMISTTEDRLNIFLRHYAILGTATDKENIERSIEFLRAISPLASRLVESIDKRYSDYADRSLAAFQILDISHSWIFTFYKPKIVASYGSLLASFLDAVSIPLGGLAQANPDHIYMNNPVWARPCIALPGDKILFPEPYLPLSFPFRILEKFTGKCAVLKKRYEEARATYLENRVAEIVRISLPSADVYKNVIWTDPNNRTNYENDVMAVLGNHIFLFEAKSGRLDDAGRRGAPKSLQENLKEFFVEPGEQAFRLQRYLAGHKHKAELRLKAGGKISLNLDKPKLVHKYSVAIEHYASLTSRKRPYVDLGLVSNESAWAPVLSIGDLEMLSRFLRTEVSFFHYLTRRPAIEELMDVDGDEQDFLSLYLANGFDIDFEALGGKTIGFSGLDKLLRIVKMPCVERTTPEALGISLSPYWKAFLRDIYQSAFPHRFDAIEALLNQSSMNLFYLERAIRKWRGGLTGNGNRDTIMTHKALGKRVYSFSVHMAKKLPSPDEWITLARKITYSEGKRRIGATDCTTILLIKRSRDSFDAISFHRYFDDPADIGFVGGEQSYAINFRPTAMRD